MRAKSPPGNHDPRHEPAYTVSEAAHYLQIPTATLRSWTLGRAYPVLEGQRFFKPVIVLASRQPVAMLSFVNLVEAHVLDAVRHEHQVTLPAVRSAIAYVRQALGSEHLLAEQKFETHGGDLFIRKLGELITVSKGGQKAMPEILNAYLKRIEWDQGLATKLYPFTRLRDFAQPKVVMIDPRVSFGRPVLTGTGIRTELIAERYKAGDSMDDLAKDYGRDRAEIEEAVRCELAIKAA